MTVVDTYYFDPDTQYAGEWIATAVKDGMGPFRPKRVDIYLDFDIEYNEYRAVAVVVLMNGYTLNHVVRINAFDFADDHKREFGKVAIKMYEAFRNRDDWPVPRNIFLGED